jgi:hypothetical protein
MLFLFWFLVVLGFEFRTKCLLARQALYSLSQAPSPTHAIFQRVKCVEYEFYLNLTRNIEKFHEPMELLNLESLLLPHKSY